MNLSHVERYFSDFLSAMESMESIPVHEEKEKLSAGICPGDYTQIKQIIEYLGRMLDIKRDRNSSRRYEVY